MPESLGPAKLGALWGAGLFICLWLGMVGTLGEILLLLPVSYVLDFIRSFLELVADGQPIYWGIVSAIVSAVTFSLI